MATASPLNDIDEKFSLCSICLKQLKEPKQLPCLHRYCKNCLDLIIQGSHDVIRCPECKEEIQIPTNGSDGFKIDFYSNSLVEYVQIQQSLKSDEVRECYSCSKHLRVAGYCFKCNDFLCKDCHNFHMTNKTLKDHQKHTLSLEDIESKNITRDKLISMRDAPRCHTHPEKLSELFCETCDNLPLCMACTFGEHKGHDIHEVKSLASLKRQNLVENLETLVKIEKDKTQITPQQAKEILLLNVNNEKEKVVKMHDEKDQRIVKKIQDIEGRRQQVKQEKHNKEKELFDSVERDMENEIQRVKKKYEEIFKVKKTEIADSFQSQERSLEKELAQLYEKRERLNKDKKEWLESLNKQLTENVKVIETIVEHFDNKRKRLETLNMMASGILASENDWSVVQCIPDVCTAATNLMEDLRMDFLQLTKLTDVTVNYQESSFGRPSTWKISEQIRKKITITNQYKFVFSITSSGDGNIVISGVKSDRCTSFVIVIDTNGRILKEKILKTGCIGIWRYCDSLSQHEVASVRYPNEVGLYDVCDGSHSGMNLSDVISSWPKGRYVTCVATDPVNNHILVGGYNIRDVYVFDDQLNYLHILTLPDMIKWPQDITVGDGHLIVCDYDGKKSYLTTMEGLESKLVGEFMKPDLEGDNFGPIRVCTDKNHSVYMLWKSYGETHKCYLVQYIHDGSQLLATRKLDGDAEVVTTVETSQGENLVVATYKTQTLYFYDLVKEV